MSCDHHDSELYHYHIRDQPMLGHRSLPAVKTNGSFFVNDVWRTYGDVCVLVERGFIRSMLSESRIIQEETC